MFSKLIKKSKQSVVFVLILCLSCLMTTKLYAVDGAFVIKDVSYGTLEEAVEQASDGATIQLQRSVSLPECVNIPSAKNLTLDLGGFTLTSERDEASQSMLSISGEGRFTLRNGSLAAMDKDGDGFTGGALSVNQTAFVMEEVQASGFHKAGNGAIINANTAQ